MQELIENGQQLDEQYSEMAFKKIDVDYQIILDCVKNSFDDPNDKNSDNGILSEDRKW